MSLQGWGFWLDGVFQCAFESPAGADTFEREIQFLGLSRAMGETPTVEARIIAAWNALHMKRRGFTSRCLSKEGR